MEDGEQHIRDELSNEHLLLMKGQHPFMTFDNIDSYVALSRGNTSTELVMLYPFDSAPGNYEFWDKVGQMVGNLTELQMIVIKFNNVFGDGARMLDWQTLALILRYLQQKVWLVLPEANIHAEVEDSQGLCRVIHGHPMISGFISKGGGLTFANLGSWCCTLVSLPSLEILSIGLVEPETEDQRVLLNVEPLTELLRSPALRVVKFDRFYFTHELCRATANALEENSSFADITFNNQCTFPDGGGAIIANALKTNVTATAMTFLADWDESFCNAMGAVLLCNSTLQNLTLRLPEEGVGGMWLCPIFLSLRTNTTLKGLHIEIFDAFGDELCEAITNGLAKNSTLEELSLDNMIPCDDDGSISARNLLSFLRTNSTLKSLIVSFAPTQKESYVSAFRLKAVKMMEKNTFLESLTIIENNGIGIEVEELFALLSALQLNTTLKTLDFQSSSERLSLTDYEGNQLVSILRKNYGLERLMPDPPCAVDGIVKAILRLNAAGRRYLIKDGSSVSKGVDVLSVVSDEIDCVFLHLLENPSLCDRRAAETSTTGR
jgi:hypothetical protein